MSRPVETILCGILLCQTLASLSAAEPASADQKAARPNIVIVLADDLGYGDLGCYGNPSIRTPNIDRFAAEGLKLSDCYAAHANCSPSRAGLMTGRTPTRLGIFNWIPVYSPMHLQRSELTIAALLRNAGYDTCHVGKWHLSGDLLGGRTPFVKADGSPLVDAEGKPTGEIAANIAFQPQPWDHGFSHWFATQNNALPNHRNPVNFVRNGKPVGPLQGYSADLVADEATRWLESRGNSSDPFFLFVCFHEPHEPIATDKRFSDLYPSDDPSFSAHHGNVSQLDAGFGKLLTTLERLDARDNTFIFFTSDNGPAITGMHPHGSTGPLRDRKGYLYEGGIRVPGLIQWPGHVTPGSVSSEAVSGVDALPTVCQIAGVKTPDDRALDGTSFLPVLDGRPIDRKQPLYWHFNRASGEIKVAIRDGVWKLCARLNVPSPRPSGGITAEEIADLKTAELTGFELYNLSTDAAETADVSTDHPQLLATLQQKMQTIYNDVRQEAPIWPAWNWPRYEAHHIEWPDYWLNRKRPK
ncbi:sulfatase-like hydrolase/transferase [bacterium]|nr:sulfatase-like hydrolase/transferase [bacterium]